MMKRRIRQNVYGNWFGYEGARRVMMFVNLSVETAEQGARRWLETGETQEQFLKGLK